jgi:hypothetical protein
LWIDLFELAFYEEELSECRLQDVTGPSRNMYLGFKIRHEEDDNVEKYLELPVMKPQDSNELYECNNIIYNYWSSRFIRETCHRAVIAWDSLPTLDRLVRSYRLSSHVNIRNFGSPFSRLQRAVREFALEYSNSVTKLPLVRTFSKAL